MPSDVSTPARVSGAPPRVPGGDERRDRTILEWYRWDETPRIKRVLLRAALLTLGGALLVSHGLAPSAGYGAWAWIASGLGLSLTVSGPLSAILGLRGILAHDSYLALRRDGVCIHTDAARCDLSWDEIEAVHVEADARTLRFVRRRGDALEVPARFADIDAKQLAQRIEVVRRKAIWNVLHTLAR